MLPAISIIIPVYNAASTLDKCVRSILQQDFPNFEVLLVNDGSADNSLEVMQQLAALDSRIIAIDKSHSGVSGTRNLALEHARGEYICFIDADDIVDANYLSAMYAHRDCDMVICGYLVDWYSTDGELHRQESQKLPQIGEYDISNGCDCISKLFAYGKVHINCNKLLKRSIIEQHNIRYMPIPVNEDYMFMIDYLRHAKRIYAVEEVPYHWIRVVGNRTGVDSMPDNLLDIYLEAYEKTALLFLKKELVDHIFYYTFDFVIRKYLTAEKQMTITKEESRKTLSRMFSESPVKSSLSAHNPSGIGEFIMKLLLKLKLFGLYKILFIKS